MSKYLKENIQYRIKSIISSAIRRKLKDRDSNKNGKKTWHELLNYSVKELSCHLESKFQEGMTWENYGKVWHIDHKTPDSWFNYKSVNDEGFKKSWSLENLQPMFACDNFIKNNRYSG